MKLLAQIKEVYGSALFAFRPVDALSLDGLLRLLPECTRIAHNLAFYIFMVLEAAQQEFVLVQEREGQRSSGSPHASPQGLVPLRRERPLHHRASLAFPESINA